VQPEVVGRGCGELVRRHRHRATSCPTADRVARELFDSATLDAWRSNRAGAIDPWRLGRTPVLASDGLAFFKAKVKGRLDGEALAYRMLRRGPWGRA